MQKLKFLKKEEEKKEGKPHSRSRDQPSVGGYPREAR